MNTKKLFEEQVIELNDSLKYYVIKETLYNNQLYLFANELNAKEEPTEDVAILKVINDPSGIKIKYENDEATVKVLLGIFNALLDEPETLN